MNKVIAKLSDWHRLYIRLQDARSRLEKAPPDSRNELEAEVSRLQQESDSQLDDLNGAVAASKRPLSGNQPPSSR